MSDDLTTRLREYAEWAAANEWEVPLMLGDHLKEAAETIEKLARNLKDCRNELCLRCGQYKQRHLGACDGCRWRDMG